MHDEIEAPQVPAGTYPAAKAALDFAAALALSVLLAPVMLVVMALVKLTSRGPAVYSQQRVGRDGRPYTIYKFRTMRHNCEAVSGPKWSHGEDPRITRLGQFLRKTHFDELPQLWNVLRGEMSLVGPRPERPVFVAKLALAVPGYAGRLAVRPGVTGLAQVQLPPDSDLESVSRKLVCDLYYVQHASLWMDVRIILATALGLLFVPHGTSCRLLALPRPAGLGDPEAAPVGIAAGPELAAATLGDPDSGEAVAVAADAEPVARMQPA
jgi:lipopolysaccharide/colanic/teichoic acid biosynthesis glycosyltransferase